MEATAELEPEVASEVIEQPEPEQQDQPQAVAPAPEPTEQLPTYIREHYEAIREKERQVRDLEDEYLHLKHQCKDAKEEFELADKYLRDLISRGPDPQKRLPLGEPELPKNLPRPKRIKLLADVSEGAKAGQEFEAIIDENCDVSIAVEGLAEPICLEAEEFEVIEWTQPEADTPATNDSDAWRKAPLTELGLTLRQNELFEGINVKTIGDMEDLRALIAEGKPDAQWPKGIGPANVTNIETRIIDWLDKNRDKFGEPVAA